MNNPIAIFIFLLCGVLSCAFADGISVHLSQRKVGLNDSFSVTFSSPHSIKEVPNFLPLHEDFDVVSNSQESNISIINGQISQETRWNVVLIGKREGNLIIPEIRFGEYSSAPQAIEITSPLAVKQDDAIFMETELSPKDSVYEHSLLTYTVRLYCSVKMAQATLTDINLNDKDAIVQRLGNDIEYDHYHQNGKHYRVYERKYIIFPQHAGELVVSPLVFEGTIISSGSHFFDMKTKIKRLHSDKQVIAVKPIPAPFQKNNWLAANDVKLTEDWSVDPNKAILGEPITWTLKLSADGCLGDHIPDINIDFPNHLKYYMDKAEISNQNNANGLMGTKQIKVALIPTKSGKIELPKISVSWWDLKAEKVRQVDLPARTINIQENNIAMNSSSEGISTDISTSSPLENSKTIFKENAMWIWWTLGLASLLLIGLFSVLFCVRRTKAAKPDSLKGLRNDLKRACQEGNAKQAETSLMIWFSIKYPECKSLNLLAINLFVDEDLQAAIQELYKSIYGKNTVWHGERLWKAFYSHKFHNKTNSKKEKKLLIKLYP
ncbi:MAG: protein BatD [Parachlamydiaceae bacterium]|nr:protein BatD [Parachlamydiaceae bacterium]